MIKAKIRVIKTIRGKNLNILTAVKPTSSIKLIFFSIN
jgi:hypothetical protein